MQCDIRAMTPCATLLTHFSTVDVTAGAWPKAFDMPGTTICLSSVSRALFCLCCLGIINDSNKTLGGRGSALHPAGGALPQTL